MKTTRPPMHAVVSAIRTLEQLRVYFLDQFGIDATSGGANIWGGMVEGERCAIAAARSVYGDEEFIEAIWPDEEEDEDD